MNAKIFLGAVFIVAANDALASETIRCGRWLLNSSATVAELIQKCGKPKTKKREEQEIRTAVIRGTTRIGSAKVGTTVTEYWTYDRGTQAAPVVVKIVDGKIHSIERIL